VSCAEADGRCARVDVVPVVVVVGDAEFATVLGAVGVAVADEGAFPLLGSV
jgi:hypothetical protein